MFHINFDLSTFRLELSAFLIWMVHSSVPSLYECSQLSAFLKWNARFPYIEYSDLSAFFVWECVHVNLSTCPFLIWNVQISVHVPSLYGMFRSRCMYLPYTGCSVLNAVLIPQAYERAPTCKRSIYPPHLLLSFMYRVQLTQVSTHLYHVRWDGTQMYILVRASVPKQWEKIVYSQPPPSPIPNHIKSHSPLEVQTFQFHH